MQSLNIITNVLSQDTDLQSKDNLDMSNDYDKKANFSHLVNQHVASEKQMSDNKNKISADKTRSGESRKTFAASQNNGQQITDRVNPSSDVSTKAQPLINADELSAVESELSNAETSYQAEASQVLVVTNQNTPEQFMTLLYSSDKTLTSSTSLSNLLSTEADSITNKSLSEVDVATVNPLKVTMSTEVTKPVLAVDSSTKLGKTDTEYTLLRNDELLPSEKNINKLADNSADTELNYLTKKTLLMEKNKLGNEVFDNKRITEQTSAAGLSKEQGNQASLKNSGVIANNNVVSDIDNQLDAERNITLLAQQSVSEAIDDSLVVHTSNITVDGKIKTVNLDQMNNNVNDTKSNKGQVQNLSKDHALNNNIVTDSSFNDSSQPEAETSQQSNINTEQALNRREILSQHVMKNSVKQNQLLENNGQYLKESIDKALSPDTENLISIDEKPVATKAINSFSNNFNTRFAQETQFQTSQALQNNQTNEAYLAHQVSEALNHSIASDTVHIQKNNVQLQQETIAIFRKDFAEALKDKVLVMINQKLQKFEITLDPPEFGNMQVRVNLQGDQASVNFIVQNQQAKEALEQNMQKLKDMLADQGVDVGGADVEQQTQGEDNSKDNNLFNGNSLHDNLVNDGDSQEVFSVKLSGSPETAIDYYA
jgi:flagellar hook-length control protein FliK